MLLPKINVPFKKLHYSSNCVLLKEANATHVSFSCNNEVSKGAKIRNRYNQVPYLTQDTNGKVTDSQLDTTKSCSTYFV